MSKDMELALACLQAAVDEELERKAKLGYKAVVSDKSGRPKIVSAATLLRQRGAGKKGLAAL
jgi:hypothetical protein